MSSSKELISNLIMENDRLKKIISDSEDNKISIEEIQKRLDSVNSTCKCKSEIMEYKKANETLTNSLQSITDKLRKCNRKI